MKTTSVCPPKTPAPAGALWHRITARLGLPALVLLTLCFIGCQSPQNDATAAAAAVAAPETAEAIRLGEGDVIRVTFEADTNMNTVAKIQLGGFVNLPLTGDVKVAGKSLEELKADLMKRYETLLKINEINVALLESAASITVSGAVLKPGRIPLDRPLTVLDAVMDAGGFDPTRAKLNEVTVFRVENGQQRHYVLNLKRDMKGPSTPFYLKPFDIVHVPEKRFNF